MSAQPDSARPTPGGLRHSAGKHAGTARRGGVSSGTRNLTKAEQRAGIVGVHKVFRNWDGNVVSHPRVVVQPQSAKQIMQIIANAKTFPGPVRAVGANQSPTRCAVADEGTLVDMRKFDRIVRIENDRVTVQAGVLYKDLARRLYESGLQLPVDVDFGNFTMGSAACGQIKGLAAFGQSSLLSSYMTAARMITPTGRELTVTGDKGDLIRVVRSSYGLMGLVYEATFEVIPLQNRYVEFSRYSLDDFVGRFPEISETGEPCRFHMFPFRDAIIVEKWKTISTDAGHRDRFWKSLNWLDVYAIRGFAYLLKKMPVGSRMRYRLLDAATLRLQDARSRLTNRVAVDSRAFIKPYPEKAKPWTRFAYCSWAFPAMSYDIVLDAYFHFCRDYFDLHRYRTDLPTAGCRIEQDSASFFSPSLSGTVFTIEPMASDASGWSDFLIDFNDFCSRHGGVPFFNQTPALTPQQVRNSFGERMNSFRLLRHKVDPTNRLANPFFQELLK